jgi:hypothetical protein
VTVDTDRHKTHRMGRAGSENYIEAVSWFHSAAIQVIKQQAEGRAFPRAEQTHHFDCLSLPKGSCQPRGSGTTRTGSAFCLW